MFRGLPFLILAPLLLAASRAQAAQVLLWAPPGQSLGSTDSARELGESLRRLGVEAVATADLLAQDFSAFAAVLSVLGTFPRNHILIPAEADALAAYLEERRGALYLEGGDAWYDLPPRLAALLGVSPAGDGAGDLFTLEGLDARPGPNLGGLELRYRGENRSIDRLRLDGGGPRPLWRNRDTGAVLGIFHASPLGYRVIGASFEFGGLRADRDAVLRSYLISLGVLEACVPQAAGLSASVEGRWVVLNWENGAAYDRITVVRDGEPAAALPGGARRFEDEPGPGEHRYQVIGRLGGCEAPPSFRSTAVLRGAHLIWRPVETLAGPADSAGEVAAALESNGRAAVFISDLSGVDLRMAAGLWAILGTHPFRHPLSPDEGRLLHDYLLGARGQRLYLEGGDLWGGDSPTALRSLDGVRLVADAGARRLRYLRGLDTAQGFNLAALVRLPVDYTAETESIDILAPDPAAPGAGAAWIDDDSGEVVGVFRRDPAGRFSLLSASFEFAGATQTPQERALLMELYLTVLESPPFDPLFRRGDANGDGVVTVTDSIQILLKLFLGGALDQGCEDAADVDDDGLVGLTDAILGINYLFLAGSPPASPGPDRCGPDPTPQDSLPECRPLATSCGE